MLWGNTMNVESLARTKRKILPPNFPRQTFLAKTFLAKRGILDQIIEFDARVLDKGKRDELNMMISKNQYSF